MRVKNEKELVALPLAPAYLLCGSQDYLIEKALRATLKRAVEPGMEAFNLQRFDGKAGADWDNVLDAVEALPLMAPRKCVVVDDLDPESVSAADFDRLALELGDLPTGCTLILTVKSFPIKAVKGKKKDKAGKLVDLFEKSKSALVLELSAHLQSDATKMIRELADQRGCTLPADVAALMYRRVGGDMLTLRSETEKLCGYAGGGTLTKAQVEAVGALTIDAGIFELSKAIFRRDYAGSLKVIGDLLYQKEQPTSILAAVTGAFVDLYRAKTAKRAKVDATQAMNDLGYYGPRQFRYTNAASDEGKYSKEALRQALAILAQGDMALKSERIDGRVVLEKTITQLFMLPTL